MASLIRRLQNHSSSSVALQGRLTDILTNVPNTPGWGRVCPSICPIPGSGAVRNDNQRYLLVKASATAGCRFSRAEPEVTAYCGGASPCKDRPMAKTNALR